MSREEIERIAAVFDQFAHDFPSVWYAGDQGGVTKTRLMDRAAFIAAVVSMRAANPTTEGREP